MAEQTELEVEVTDADGKKIKVKLKKVSKEEAELEADGSKKTLKPIKKKKGGTKFSGLYEPGWGFDDRDITFVLHCDKNPPELEMIVTFAEGSDKGKKDTGNCKVYKISKEVCEKLRKFIDQLDMPEGLAMAAPEEIGPVVAAAIERLAEEAFRASASLRFGDVAMIDAGESAAFLPPAGPGARVRVEKLASGLSLRIDVDLAPPPARKPAKPAKKRR